MTLLIRIQTGRKCKLILIRRWSSQIVNWRERKTVKPPLYLKAPLYLKNESTPLFKNTYDKNSQYAMNKQNYNSDDNKTKKLINVSMNEETSMIQW